MKSRRITVLISIELDTWVWMNRLGFEAYDFEAEAVLILTFNLVKGGECFASR